MGMGRRIVGKRILSCVLLLVVTSFGFVACSSDGGDDSALSVIPEVRHQ